jgi:hypothetical protein
LVRFKMTSILGVIYFWSETFWAFIWKTMCGFVLRFFPLPQKNWRVKGKIYVLLYFNKLTLFWSNLKLIKKFQVQSFWVRLAWPKRPKIVCSPSYVDIRSRANTTMGLDFEHMIKARAHKGGVRIGKTPKKLASICCP